MNIKINTTCNYRKSVVLKIQLKIGKHPELVKSVPASWGTGAQVNLIDWAQPGSNGLRNEVTCMHINEVGYFWGVFDTFVF